MSLFNPQHEGKGGIGGKMEKDRAWDRSPVSGTGLDPALHKFRRGFKYKLPDGTPQKSVMFIRKAETGG